MIKTTFKVILPLLVLAAGAFVAWKIVLAAPVVTTSVEPKKAPQVRVQSVVKETVRLTVEAYGTARAYSEIQIVPEVPGRVVHVSPSMREGGFFEEGEELVRIDDRDYVLAKTQAEAVVAQAEARLVREKAEQQIAREEWEEFGKGEPSPLVLREPQLAEANAQLASAKARREVAELALSRTRIVAPFAGRVRMEKVDLGQFLMAGAPIATVYSTDYAEVRLAIPDEELQFLDLPLDYSVGLADGSPAEDLPVVLKAIFAGAVHEWSGTITRTAAEVDPRTRVVHTVARVKDPYSQPKGHPPLMIGMYVRAEIPGRKVEGVARLPRSVLRGPSRVLVVDAESRLRYREVEVLRREGDDVLVSAGLEEGERVCVSPIEPALEGMLVRVVQP